MSFQGRLEYLRRISDRYAQGPREGSYGLNNNAVERPPGVPTCLPQKIAVCP